MKKLDTMQTFTNSTTAAQTGGTTFTQSSAVVNGGLGEDTCAAFIWCATARDLSPPGGGANSTVNQAARTSTTCYMRSLSEKIEIQTSNGKPWQWRRICFTAKGFIDSAGLASTTTFYPFLENSNGYTRMMNQLAGTPAVNPMYGPLQILFRGQVNSDWVDPMTAPTDNTRVTIKYDKIVTLSSGNEQGFIRTYRRTHPMFKNLVYDDDESGAATQAAYTSVEGKQGMGDYWVVDLFRCRQGSSATDQLMVRPTAQLRWSEK